MKSKIPSIASIRKYCGDFHSQEHFIGEFFKPFRKYLKTVIPDYKGSWDDWDAVEYELWGVGFFGGGMGCDDEMMMKAIKSLPNNIGKYIDIDYDEPSNMFEVKPALDVYWHDKYNELKDSLKPKKKRKKK